MEWKHTLGVPSLVDSSIIETVIDEPIGFDEIVFMVQRDDVWHGIFFEASTSQLSFYGTAYNILKAQKKSFGIDATVIYTAQVRCVDGEDFEEAISGKLNFSAYNETCGNTCFIKMMVEQNTCAMTFKNRFDQKVSVDSLIAFDKITNLLPYDGLGFNMLLATQVIPISADASVAPEGDIFELTDLEGAVTAETLIRPTYAIVRDNSINTGQLNDPFNVFQQADGPFLLSPQVLIEENDACVPGDWNYNVRQKGTVKVSGINNASSWLVFGYWDGTAILYNSIIDIEPEVVIQNPMADGVEYPFDITYTGSVALPYGVGVYAFVKIIVVGLDTRTYYVKFEPETSFLLSHDKACPPSSCSVYLINETLSRITESITDRCLTVDSEYYGRTDSQPHLESSDGCGSLRVLTNGLKIRQADDKKFFASMKDVMEGLRAIDNIGMGMDNNVVRVEEVKYFYQNTKILDIDFIPSSNANIDSNLTYSNIKIGYNKWEIKSIKGIDEFNSTKEYRTSLKSINNELDISSDLIAGGYIIESLRTATLVNTGNADSTYDNDIFIICVERETEYLVTFSAAGNSMEFETSSNGNKFLIASITIAGSVSNNGTRTILSTSITSNPNSLVKILITFSGGATVDEVSANVTFPGIINSGVHVEQGIVENAANLYSPATAYNWRIRPIYNLMRWFKSIAQSYVSLSSTYSKLFFTSGKGNYLAEGNISPYDVCRLENKIIEEDRDISYYDFQNTEDWEPIYQPEIITFEYPLSIRDYKLIKDSPYGYISYQCGTGNFEKGFIKSLAYKPAVGTATFTLIKKWQ